MLTIKILRLCSVLKAVTKNPDFEIMLAPIKICHVQHIYVVITRGVQNGV